MYPDLLVSAVQRSALESDSYVAFAGVDGGDLRWASPTCSVLVGGFIPDVHKVSDTVLSPFHGSLGFGSVCPFESSDSC